MSGIELILICGAPILGIGAIILLGYKLEDPFMIVTSIFVILVVCFFVYGTLWNLGQEDPESYPFFGKNLPQFLFNDIDANVGISASANLLFLSASASLGTDTQGLLQITVEQGIEIPVLIGTLEFSNYETFNLHEFQMPGFTNLLLIQFDDNFCVYDLRDQDFQVQFEENQWYIAQVQYEQRNILVSVSRTSESDDIVINCPTLHEEVGD